MRRIAYLLLVACLVGACDGSRSSASPPATSAPGTAGVTPAILPATATPLPSSPAAVATASDTADATSTACPAVSPMTIDAFWHAAEAGCFGTEDLQIQGYIDAPPGIGFGPTWIEPKWLYFPVFTWALWPVPPGDDQSCGGVDPCNGMFVFVNPKSGDIFKGPARWVIVTGHINDPAAATCHFASDPPQEFSDADNAAARESCAGQFVVTRVVNAP